MGKTKIEYADMTWNPIVGCKHGCFYCYAKRMNDRFKWIENWKNPIFFGDRLNEPLKNPIPTKYLVSSMSDIMGDWVDSNVLQRIILRTNWRALSGYPDIHTFLFIGISEPTGGAV